MESDLRGRLQVYSATDSEWKVGTYILYAEPKIKKIYKMVKKEKPSKIVRNYKRPIKPRSLKKDWYQFAILW